MAATVAIPEDVLSVLRRSTITGNNLVLPAETYDSESSGFTASSSEACST